MKSSLPKVLHSVAGEPLLFHIIESVKAVSPDAELVIVVGHGRELVEAQVTERFKSQMNTISFVHQAEQKGTGHAARCAMDSPWGEKMVKGKYPVLILPGDLPLMPSSLVDHMLQPLGRTAAMRLLTCFLPDPKGYGRIVRKGKAGSVLRIVEEKDASVREKAIQEVGASIYSFQAAFLQAGLRKLSNKNAQAEYYLTDLISQASGSKKEIDVLVWPNAEDVRGVNDLWELSLAEEILNQRIVEKWAREGVRFYDPRSTRIEVGVELAQGVQVGAGVVLQGKTKIKAQAKLGPHVVLKDTLVGEGATLKTGTVCESAIIEREASVGPYAHLRPDSKVGAGAKIGNFVELKKTTIGAKTSVAHLSYLGDATVGEGVNIGCGFVTCNFDGRVINGSRKHQTIIEDGVFMGSDCQTVAPVRIGKGSFVASGSTVTEDVPEDSLAIARSRQVTKTGYAKKLRGEK